MANNASELPFALLAWIKRQQQEEQEHQEYMVRKNLKDDLEYMFYLHALVTQFARLKKYEQNLVLSFTEWKDAGKLFSPKQRSVIGNLYASYMMEVSK